MAEAGRRSLRRKLYDAIKKTGSSSSHCKIRIRIWPRPERSVPDGDEWNDESRICAFTVNHLHRLYDLLGVVVEGTNVAVRHFSCDGHLVRAAGLDAWCRTTAHIGGRFLIGVASGMSASLLYVPLFQIIFDPSSIMPPFEVMIGRTDLPIWRLIAIMLVLALAFLTYLLSRIQIHQAVKLGED